MDESNPEGPPPNAHDDPKRSHGDFPLRLSHQLMVPKRAKRSKSSLSSVTFAMSEGEKARRPSSEEEGEKAAEIIPILVGYAFGPKKMSTMGHIMAEASRLLEVGEEHESAPQSVVTGRREAQGPSTRGLEASGGRSAEKSLECDPTVVTFASTVSPHSVGGPSQPLPPMNGNTRDGARSSNEESWSAVDVGLQAVLPAATRFRFSFVPLDLNYPLEEQHGGKFDVILHKLTEDILLSMSPKSGIRPPSTSDRSFESPSADAVRRLDLLEEYRMLRPSCCFVDPVENIKIVLSRSEIAETLCRCLEHVTTVSGLKITTPNFHVVRASDAGAADVDDLVDSMSIGFPMIAKPLTAAGTSESHKMRIVLNRKGLANLPVQPCLLQEYANHGGILFKVYVLGKDVFVFQRPSLPNLPLGESDADSCSHVEFDSQKPYPRLSDFNVAAPDHGASSTPNDIVITPKEIRPVASAIRQTFGLDLFGFDVLAVKHEADYRLLVVDINYFPSYKEVSNFPILLTRYLTERAVSSRLQSLNNSNPS